MSERTVGIVGLGAMGLRHAKAVSRVSSAAGLTLVGGVDRRATQADALDEAVPGARFFSDLEEMLALRPEIVVIATTAPSHHSIFEAVRSAGVRRMVIEKPLCSSLDEADAMGRAAERDGLRVVVNISRRYSPVYRDLAERIHGGDIVGPPVSFVTALGASGLGCNGTHLLDLGLMLLGAAPVEIAGRLTKLGLPNPRGPEFDDPGGFGHVLLGEGRRILIDMGDDFGVQAKYQLLGRHGRIVIDEIGRAIGIEARDGAGREQPLSRVGTPLLRTDLQFEPALDPVDLAARALVDAAGEGSVACGIDQATDALKLVIGFHLSHESGGAPVRFDEVASRAEGRVFTFT